MFGKPLDRSSVLGILKAKYTSTIERKVVAYRVKFSTIGLALVVESGVRGSTSITSMPGSSALSLPISIWVPSSIMAYAFPAMVASFDTSVRPRKPRCKKPRVKAVTVRSISIIFVLSLQFTLSSYIGPWNSRSLSAYFIPIALTYHTNKGQFLYLIPNLHTLIFACFRGCRLVHVSVQQLISR